MAEKELSARISLRHDTKANWTSVNPVLLLGEAGVESDTGKLKVGDGATTWNNLNYYGGGGSAIDDDDIVDILGGVSSEPQESILISEVQNMISQSVAQAVASVKAELNATTTQAVNAAKADILNKAYPVGAIYISVDNTNPHDLFGGEWERIADGMTLWGADSTGSNVNTTKLAGLPNITGSWYTGWNQRVRGFHSLTATGAFYRYSDTSRPGRITAEDGSANNSSINGMPYFDASRSNPIYGASTTVQPPALVVNMWKRTK